MWELDAKDRALSQCSKVMEGLLSRVKKYKSKHWTVYLNAALAMIMYYSFVFDNDHFPKLSFGINLVLDTSRTLKDSNIPLLRCTAAHLYILFCTYCQATPQYEHDVQGMGVADHDNMLHLALETLHQANWNYILGGQWKLERTSWFTKKKSFTVSDASPGWLAWHFKESAEDDYHMYVSFGLNVFVIKHLTVDPEVQQSFAKKLQMPEEVVIALSDAFKESCKNMYRLKYQSEAPVNVLHDWQEEMNNWNEAVLGSMQPIGESEAEAESRKTSISEVLAWWTEHVISKLENESSSGFGQTSTEQRGSVVIAPGVTELGHAKGAATMVDEPTHTKGIAERGQQDHDHAAALDSSGEGPSSTREGQPESDVRGGDPEPMLEVTPGAPNWSINRGNTKRWIKLGSTNRGQARPTRRCPS